MAKDQSNSFSEKNIVPIATNGRKVFVVSDLHMAAGMKDNGNYDGTENFYADQSFVRFLDHLQEGLQNRKGLLIINGDFVDFLRISDCPKKTEVKDDFLYWRQILQQAGIERTEESLRQSIVPKEIKYGLKTHDYKSIWKLDVCIKGHKAFFRRLARWVQDDNRLIVLTGNHDLEWWWEGVQRYLRVALQNLASEDGEIGLLEQKAESNISFVNDALILDGRIYIEHGHRYESITAVEGEPTINDGAELNLPFGSLLNRYLINKFELSYPFLDNVRPTENILKVLFKENFPKALRVLTVELPYALHQIPKRYNRFILRYLIPSLLVIVLPLVVTILAVSITAKHGGFDRSLGFWPIVSHALLCSVFLFLSYLIAQLLVHVAFKKDSPFVEDAKKIMAENEAIEAVLFGHTHDPEQTNLIRMAGTTAKDYQWYFNTGTWIPVFETSSADVRFDKTYTFITIDCNDTPACRERLQRWNDDAGRVDAMILNDKM